MAKKAVNFEEENKKLSDKINELQNQVNSGKSTINSLQSQLQTAQGNLTIERQTTQDLSNSIGNLQREKSRYFLLYNQTNQELQQLKNQSEPAK
ncbi:hypothetical protein EFN70_02930 [Pediococcus ethanolidurans]|uniref:hypothetical protein n=1 Tax=Pediococcus ethanolidurans TaxID=319653 RepID=UPI0021AAC2A4|nr:hypothetical protein [Pediococcus ethanolidurans]MCT4397635.1 hypothetical protein [Pediococcus ethanolidurans]